MDFLVGFTQFLQSLTHLLTLSQDVLHRYGIGIDLIRVSFLGNQCSILGCSFLCSHGIHVHKSQRICDSLLETIRHMALLVVAQKKLVQLTNYVLDLVPHNSLFSALNSPLSGLLPFIEQFSLGLCCLFLIGCKCFLTLLLSSLVCHLFLSGKDIL